MRPRRNSFSRGAAAARKNLDSSLYTFRNPKAQLQGMLARRRGKSLEDLLELAHAVYQRRDLAKIDRNHPETVGVPGKMRYKRRSTVDFDGTLAGGRAICFDAKSLSGKASFQVDARDRHQLDHLRQMRDLGAVAFYLVYDPEMQVAWLLGGRALDALATSAVTLRRKAKGQVTHLFPTVAESTLAEIARGKANLDYLPVALAAYGALPGALPGA